MAEEKKEHEHVHEFEHHKKSGTEKIRENPWILATFVLGILSIVLLVSIFSGNFTGGVISSNDAGTKLLGYYQAMGVSNLTLSSVTEVSGVYQVNLNYKGQIVPLYITKDGKNIIDSLTPTETNSSSSSSNTQTQTVPKSDKPTVELFVMSYCPYGTQMEKAIIPVLNLLRNKIDFTLRFVDYSMHGQKEVDENVVQYCIQKEQNDKFLTYLSCFLQSGDEKSCLTSSAIDQTKLNSCISSTDTQFSVTKTADATVASGNYPPFDIDKTLNQQYSVQGSPTLIINGVEAQPSDRSPESVKGVICNAFNNVPSECGTTLDTAQTSPGFGSDSSSSSSTGTQCATA